MTTTMFVGAVILGTAFMVSGAFVAWNLMREPKPRYKPSERIAMAAVLALGGGLVIHLAALAWRMT